MTDKLTYKLLKIGDSTFLYLNDSIRTESINIKNIGKVEEIEVEDPIFEFKYTTIYNKHEIRDHVVDYYKCIKISNNSQNILLKTCVKKSKESLNYKFLKETFLPDV